MRIYKKAPSIVALYDVSPWALSAALCGGDRLGGVVYRGEPLAGSVGRVVGSAGCRGDVL